ncbi:MAG: hypothetical protein JJE04_18405 [Acidobacteriia bacterium]|nr:hypothetical protein [Terriglobia bacterium]
MPALLRNTRKTELLAALVCAGTIGWCADLVALPPLKVAGAHMEGGALEGRLLYSWGDRVRVHALEKPSTRLLGGESGFGPGGCVVDVNEDGRMDLVLHQRQASLGEMVWLEAPRFQKRVIDTGADFRDCIGVKVLGRRGVLVTHRQMQVRFYEVPKASGVWPYREIYSIYTASAQGGLRMADVNGDGLPDILSGNYWIQSPAAFELGWRLFAIHNWWDGPRSAMVRLALAAREGSDFPVYVAAESEADAARLSWFERPADPKSFWTEHPLTVKPALRRPQALAAVDFDIDGSAELVTGEDAGAGSRMLLWERVGATYVWRQVGSSSGYKAVEAVDVDGDGRMDLVGMGADFIAIWRNQRRR